MSRLGNIKTAADSFLNQYKTDNPSTYAAAQQAVGGLLILDGFVGIDNPFGRKRSGIWGSFISIIIGIILVIGMTFFVSLMGLDKLTATTTATVTSVSQPFQTTSGSNGSCTPQATYVVNGQQYTQTAASGSSSACSLTIGQNIDINYNPNSPGTWGYDINTAKTVMKIFPLVGVLMILAGFITFIIRLLSIIFGWKLLKNGRALAKTLPTGTDLSTIKNEIKQNFTKHLLGFGTESNV